MVKLLEGPSRQKYSEKLKSFVLTLHYYSPRAYTYLRDTFNKTLPDPRTIRRWYADIEGGPGFNQHAIAAIKTKVEEFKKRDITLVGGLLMDEISIRKLIEWTGKKLTGYSDWKGYIGKDDGDEDVEEAKEVLVFMVVCQNANFKIPVAYFLINGITGQEKSNLILKLLEHLNTTGIIITSLTFDGLSANFTMASALGADLNTVENLKPWFTYKYGNIDRKIFIFLDPSHMLKLVRNRLGSKKVFIYNNSLINWEYFEKLVKVQNLEGLHAATKISLRHINWQKEKMKVKLAAQTFSRSVRDAFLFLSQDLKFPEFRDVECTANFCLLFNNLFDIFNCRNLNSKSQYRKPLSKGTINLIKPYLESCFEYITQLNLPNEQKIIESQSKTGFLRFMINIKSYIQFYEYLIDCENPVLEFLLSYKLSQDHLEIFFSAIRSRGGFNNNPSARQFESAFKRLLIHTDIKGSLTGNISVLDENTAMLSVETSSMTPSDELCQFLNPYEHDYAVSPKSWHLTEYCSDVIGYIAGFVVKKLEGKINCEKCLGILKNDFSSSKLQIRKSYGNLTSSSKYVIDICTIAEKTLRWSQKSHNILKRKNKNLLEYLTLQSLESVNTDSFNVFNEHADKTHSTSLTKLILSTYINLRIHFEITKQNRFMLDVNRLRSRLTKLITFQNQ